MYFLKPIESFTILSFASKGEKVLIKVRGKIFVTKIFLFHSIPFLFCFVCVTFSFVFRTFRYCWNFVAYSVHFHLFFFLWCSCISPCVISLNFCFSTNFSFSTNRWLIKLRRNSRYFFQFFFSVVFSFLLLLLFILF